MTLYSGLVSSMSFCCFRNLYLDFCVPGFMIEFIMLWFSFLLTVVFLMFLFIVFGVSAERSRSLIILSVDSIQHPDTPLLMICVMHFGFRVISLMA